MARTHKKPHPAEKIKAREPRFEMVSGREIRRRDARGVLRPPLKVRRAAVEIRGGAQPERRQASGTQALLVFSFLRAADGWLLRSFSGKKQHLTEKKYRHTEITDLENALMISGL